MKLLHWTTSVAGIFSSVVLAGLLHGCYMEVVDGEDHAFNQSLASPTPIPDKIPLGLAAAADFCSVEEVKKSRYPEERVRLCFQSDDFRWRTSCKTGDCVEVPVFVTYLLKDNLGGSVQVAVEAFDNPRFVGAPTSTVQLTNFDASRSGTTQKTSLYLQPGQYYLRAFIANEQDSVVPYQYQNLQLVGDKPVGVHGALSSPTAVLVSPRSIIPYSLPVAIAIDKLFKDPSQGLKTNAFLRIRFSVAEIAEIPTARKLIIGLYPDADFTQAPSAQFKMPTEQLLVSNQVGKADFISPELEIGNYVVLAYIDANGNEFYDKGELSQVSSKLDQPTALAVTANHTVPLTLDLVREPALIVHN